MIVKTCKTVISSLNEDYGPTGFSELAIVYISSVVPLGCSCYMGQHIILWKLLSDVYGTKLILGIQLQL